MNQQTILTKYAQLLGDGEGKRTNGMAIFAGMGRKKSIKKEEFNDLPNCFNADETMKGRWAEHFGNGNPIIVELGCGKGDLALGLAQAHPEINYIGVDIKATRMWTGARRALEEGTENLAFLRCDIHGISSYFAPEELDGIWITFPDPFPRKKQTKNRMVNERFLIQYARILKPPGQIWFKSDNNSFFEYALEHFEALNAAQIFDIQVQAQTRDLHASDLKDADNGITTDFERRFLDIGKTINYMQFLIQAGPRIEDFPLDEKVSLDPTEKAPRLRH